MSRQSAAMISKVGLQPISWISSWLLGSRTNCPAEPPADDSPRASARFSGGALRATAASTIGKPQALTAMPIKRLEPR